MQIKCNTVQDALKVANPDSIGMNWTKIDPEDAGNVALSLEAMKMVIILGKMVLGRKMDADQVGQLTNGDIVGIFSEQLYWNESDGALFMCAVLNGRVTAIPIPAEMWRFQTTGTIQ